MTERRDEDLQQLSAAARVCLETPLSIPSAPSLETCGPLLRLWAYPSFSDHVAWHVFRRRRDSPMVRRVCWGRQADADRLLDPLRGLREGFHATPTVEIRDRPLDAAALERHLARLKEISIPVGAGRGAIMIDGTKFGIELTNGGVLIEWCDAYAPGWEPLVAWAAKTRQWLDEVCGAVEAR